MSSSTDRWGRRLLVAVAVAAGVLGACARKAAIVEPPPVEPGTIRIEGNRVVWETDRGARGSVRYGFVRGTYDHMAYPNAAGRVDREFTLVHAIPLLDVTAGRKIHYQAVSEPQTGAPTYSPPDSFVATNGPILGLLVSTMIHIGFGDSHLLTMPTSGRRLLIDAGTPGAEQAVLQYLDDHGVTRIDAMLATHTHLDHLGGEVGNTTSTTDGVVAAFPEAVYFDSESKSNSSQFSNAYQNLLATLSGQSRDRVILRRFDTSISVSELRLDPEVSIRVLNSGTPPGYVPTGNSGPDTNNESIVLRFSYRDVDFVIGGDAEVPAEESILREFVAEQLEVEMAKVHHHGLSDASSASWFRTLLPRVAFIPNTDYSWDGDLAGALSQSTSRLREVGAHVYVVDEATPLGKPRTAQQYNTSFVTDGRSYEVRIERALQAPPMKPEVSDCGPYGNTRREPVAARAPSWRVP